MKKKDKLNKILADYGIDNAELTNKMWKRWKKIEIRQNAIEFLDKRTKQKENLVISRNEAISGLCDFYETLQASTDKSKLLLADVSNRRKLLIAFADAINVCDGDKRKIRKLVDIYLKSN